MEEKRKGLRLILVDDDEDDFILMRDAFEQAGPGISIEWAQDGGELLDMLRRPEPEGASSADGGPLLVILDINMPNMDGWEALGRIRADPLLRRTPVVVMTGSTSEKDVLRAYELGASSYIRKPAGFASRVEIAGILKRYWMGTVELPVPGGALCVEE